MSTAQTSIKKMESTALSQHVKKIDTQLNYINNVKILEVHIREIKNTTEITFAATHCTICCTTHPSLVNGGK